MVKSVKFFLYLNFQTTCNVLAQWVKCRWLVVAHFLPQGNFQMLTGMAIGMCSCMMQCLGKEDETEGKSVAWAATLENHRIFYFLQFESKK